MTGLGQFRKMALAIGSTAYLLMTLAHAAGRPHSDVEQVMVTPAESTEKALPHIFPMEDFLDRLITAESGGRLDKKNPRSTALGAFQFIESTFLFVASKHFPSEVARLTKQQVLALRTDMVFSRRVARAYVRDLISALNGDGLPATTVNVRIAFLVGPSAATRLLKAPLNQPLNRVLSDDAIAANPFMSGATVAKLVQRATADVGGPTAATDPAKGEATSNGAAVKVEPDVTPTEVTGAPAIVAVTFKGPDPAAADLTDEPVATVVAVKGEPADIPARGELTAVTPAYTPSETSCNIGLASCRRWMALQERKARPRMPSTPTED